MIGQEDRFVLAPAGSTQRWVVHKPVDQHGDGHIHNMLVEISDSGVSARGAATLEGQEEDSLLGFLNGLAKDWRGWSGVKTWSALEGGMSLAARHDRLGHVKIAVTVRGEPWYDVDVWSATVVVTVEAGEELQRMADTAAQFLRP